MLTDFPTSEEEATQFIQENEANLRASAKRDSIRARDRGSECAKTDFISCLDAVIQLTNRWEFLLLGAAEVSRCHLCADMVQRQRRRLEGLLSASETCSGTLGTSGSRHPNVIPG